MDAASEAPASVAFGRFRVLPHRRELLVDGRPIKLGGRAFDVLMALIEARGAVIGKDALMARVWSGRIVEENNLQAQISALRAAFGAERKLIRTVPRRGYQFTGEIRILQANPDERAGAGEAAAEPQSPLPPTNLPEPISELIGRDDELREILSLAAAHRLVTLTGPGGIGRRDSARKSHTACYPILLMGFGPSSSHRCLIPNSSRSLSLPRSGSNSLREQHRRYLSRARSARSSSC
jgi:DNA-binding winged helix-turn-helix (wHTH) protein